MLFLGFFRTYFDRVFNVGHAVGSNWMPVGIEAINAWRWPLVGTAVLVTSGFFANHAYYLYRVGSFAHSSIFGSLTPLLAVSLSAIQCIEYNGLTFTMADSVYGSSSYILTGFHGFHVTVGILFPAEQFCVFHAEPDPDLTPGTLTITFVISGFINQLLVFAAYAQTTSVYAAFIAQCMHYKHIIRSVHIFRVT